MSHIQNHVDGTTFTANLGIGCRFAEEPTKQSEGSQTGSISTTSGLHSVEQKNSGQAGSENSPSLRCFKDAIDSSSGGSSARVRLDPANLEDVASKPVAQTPFVQALNTLLSLVDTERFPRNPTELRDSTDGCSEGEVKTINEALHAASTHYDETYGARDQDGNLQRNEQKEICFKADAPPRHQIFRQVLEQLKEPEASDAESVLVPQSLRTANPLPSVAVSLTDESDAVSPPVNKKPGAWDRMTQHNKGVKEFNQNIDTLVKAIRNPGEAKTSILDMESDELLESLSTFGQGSARLQVYETICQFKDQGADKVAEMLRGLKKQDKSIFDSSNKKVAKWFVKPVNRFNEAEFGLNGSGIFGKTKDLLKFGAFRNVFQVAKLKTENGISKKVQGYIQDGSHAPKWRNSAAVVAFFGIGVNAFAVVAKTIFFVAAAVLTQLVVWGLSPVIALIAAIAVAVISCIPGLNFYAYDRTIVQPRIDAMEARSEARFNQMKADNEARHNELLAVIAKLKNPNADEKADDASVNSTVSSVDSSKQVLLEAAAALAGAEIADDGPEGFEEE
jgi:hypothetical protein